MSDEIKEKLIAKLQLEYAASDIERSRMFTTMYDYAEMKWDFGLLYITNKNLWFVNTQKEKVKVPYENMLFVSDIVDVSGKRTKFSEILKASHMMNMVFRAEGTEETSPVASAVFIAGPKNVLNALRTQVSVRASGNFRKAYEHWLNRKLSVLMYLNIRDDEKLAYFMNIPSEDLLNLILKRSSYFK